jgi:hypothetical protein
MGTDPQQGRQVLGALGAYGFAGIGRSPHQTRPPVVARGFARVGGIPQAPWQSLDRSEQEAFITLMAELSIRAVRHQPEP